jgi:hypothetical protein
MFRPVMVPRVTAVRKYDDVTEAVPNSDTFPTEPTSAPSVPAFSVREFFIGTSPEETGQLQHRAI